MPFCAFTSHSTKCKTAAPRRGRNARAAGAALLIAAMLAPGGSTRAQQPAAAQSPSSVPPASIPGRPGAMDDWLLKYKLDPADPNIENEDPDGDGFTNLEEFLAGTDPTDKNSHPPYATKLFVEKYIVIPLRIIFNGRPDGHSFQIDTADIQQPTQILQMGDLIAGTKYKITGYVEKHKKDANNIDLDVSELTIQNTETGNKVVLSLGGQDGRDSYAIFKYFWKNPVEIRVKQDATFTLDPEPDVNYQLLDLNDTDARIKNLKTNEEIIIPRLKGGETFHLLNK